MPWEPPHSNPAVDRSGLGSQPEPLVEDPPEKQQGVYLLGQEDGERLFLQSDWGGIGTISASKTM